MDDLPQLDQAIRAAIDERVRYCRRRWDALTLAHPSAAPAELWSQLRAELAPQRSDSASSSGKQELTDQTWSAILGEVTSACLAAVRPLRVVYLGPEFSYSHQAAIARFGRSQNLSAVSTIAAVFDEMARGQADFGLVPLENSTDGRIADTLDEFARMPVRICGEVLLPIHHCLWGTGTLREIKQVHSKPQALSQCRNWLAHHLPDVACFPAASTAAAAQLAAQQPHVAAVASHHAGHALGLNLLMENIEDRPDNVTRFAVLGQLTSTRTGRDKTTVMFELPHRPGALADAINVFKKNRLNLTWIESFPRSGSANEYLFFVEFQGHFDEMRVTRAVRDLERKASRMTVLGSYPAG